MRKGNKEKRSLILAGKIKKQKNERNENRNYLTVEYPATRINFCVAGYAVRRKQLK